MDIGVGDHVYVKVRPYNWHGNGCVGELRAIEDGEPCNYVVFANGHGEYFNTSDLSAADHETPLTACDERSMCAV